MEKQIQNLTNDNNFVIENNALHMWHPMADPKVSEKTPPIIVVEGDGVYIFDIDLFFEQMQIKQYKVQDQILF